MLTASGDLFPRGLRILDQLQQDGNGLLAGRAEGGPTRYRNPSPLHLLASRPPLRVEIDEARPDPLATKRALSDQLQQGVMHAHSKQCGEFFMSHPLGTGLGQVGNGVLQCAVLGEPGRPPRPEAMAVELRRFRDREELAGMIVAAVVAMLCKSSQDRSARAAECVAELLQRQRTRRRTLSAKQFPSVVGSYRGLRSEITRSLVSTI